MSLSYQPAPTPACRYLAGRAGHVRRSSGSSAGRASSAVELVETLDLDRARSAGWRVDRRGSSAVERFFRRSSLSRSLDLDRLDQRRWLRSAGDLLVLELQPLISTARAGGRPRRVGCCTGRVVVPRGAADQRRHAQNDVPHTDSDLPKRKLPPVPGLALPSLGGLSLRSPLDIVVTSM